MDESIQYNQSIYQNYNQEVDRSKNRDGWIAAILLLFIIFGPRTSPGSSLPPIRLSDIIIFFLIISRWFKANRFYGGFIFSKRSKFFSIFMIMIMLVLLFSTIINVAIGKNPFYIKDYFTIALFFRSVLIAAIAASFHFTEKQVKQFITGVLIIAFIAAALSFVQRFRPYLVTSIIQRFYAVSYEQLDIETSGTGSRVAGTLGNANNWGACLVMLGGVCLSAFLNIKGFLKLMAFGVYVMMGLAIFLTTGSRTAVIALVLINGFSVMLSLEGGGKIWILLSGILLIMGFLFVRANVDELPINPRMKDLIRGQQSIEEGLSGRYGVWQKSLNDVKGSIFIGTGESKLNYQLADNGYIMMLLRAGLIGLSIYLLMLGGLFIRGLKAVIIEKQHFRKAIILMSFMVIVSHILYEMVADFLFNVEYIAIVAMFIGLLSGVSREAFDERNSSLYYYEDDKELQAADGIS